MPYQGPTFLPEAEYTQLQHRRFDDLMKEAPLPSEPIRVRTEQDRYDEMVTATRRPSLDAHVAVESSRFDEMTAATELPSAALAPHVEADRFDDLTGAAPLPSQAVAALLPEAPGPAPAPAALPGASIPPPGAPVDDDPVSRTLAFLSGLGGGGSVGGSFGPAPPGRSVGGDFAGESVGGSFGVEQDALIPRTTEPVPSFAQDPLGAVLGAGGEALLSGIEEGSRQRGEFTSASGRALDTGRPEDAGAALAAAEPYATALTGEPLKVIRGVGGLGQAGMSLEDVGGLVRTDGDSGPGVVYHDEITLPKGPSEFRKYWDRSRNVLGSMGEAGAEIAQRVHAWRDGWKDTAGDWATRMPDAWKLSKDEFGKMVDVLEGNATDASPKVAQAAQQAKAVLDDVYARAQAAGVDVAPQIDNYFPHRYKTPIVDQLKDDRRRAEIARHLMDTGQAATPAEAREVMVRYMTSSPDRRYGSLEMERLADLPDYEKTPEVLVEHLVGAAKRLHEVEQFGPKDALVNELFGRLSAAGYADKDVRGARDLFKVIVGAKDYENTVLPTVASGLRKYNAITRLGWAGIANLTQGANTATVAGTLRTLQSVPKAVWSKQDKEFALRAGITLDNVLKEMRTQQGGVGDRLSKVTMPFFAEIEQFNRTLTAVAGRDFAIDQARKAAKGDQGARRALDAMGLNPDAIVKRGGVLEEAEQRMAARSIDERTQFQVDPQDLPGWADSPWGKVVAQFGTFSYNQSAFVWREVVQKALEGDVRPLVRFAILAPLANAVATETRNAVQGREPEENPAKRVAQYALGTLGKAGDVARFALPINADRLPPERQAAMAMGSLLGPSLGTAADLAVAGANAAQGNWTPAARTALRQVPVVGTTLQNAIVPYEKKGASRYTLPGRPDTSRAGTGRPDTSRKDTRR